MCYAYILKCDFIFNPGYINKYMSEKSNAEECTGMVSTALTATVSIAQPLNTPQLLQAYLEIGGFRRNTQHNPTNPFGDECQFNRT
jgi:hypothetical protein